MKTKLMWYTIDKDHNITPGDPTHFEVQKEEFRRVGFDEIGNTKVSTIFLGRDHNWGDGPPVLFETMAFSDNVDYDQYQERYCTWEEAEKGHARVVENVKNGEPLNTPRKVLKLSLKT